MKINLAKIFKPLAAIFISIVFCYLAFRGVNFHELLTIVANISTGYVGISVFCLIVVQILRSLRWGVMVHPMEPLEQRLLFPITSIGFMFIILLPARLGEFVRPYLLFQNSSINMSAATATVVLERILDAIFLLIVFGIVFSSLDLPSWVIKGALTFVLIIGILIALLFLGTFRSIRNFINVVIVKVLPTRFATFSESYLAKFYQGMWALGKGRHAVTLILLSAMVWTTNASAHLFLFKAFNLPLGMLPAFSILALTALGISVPAGPGFIGNYHFFCVMALTMFGINKETALGYAIIQHALILVTLITIGLICFNIPGLHLGMDWLKSLFGQNPSPKPQD
jgi:uncharacterized protein (TIRG00374 family)